MAAPTTAAHLSLNSIKLELALCFGVKSTEQADKNILAILERLYNIGVDDGRILKERETRHQEMMQHIKA